MLAALALTLCLGAVRVQTDSTVEARVQVTPETVTVGMPFVVRVSVRAPRGAEVSFPGGPDSAASVQAIDPRVLTSTTESADTGVSDTGVSDTGVSDTDATAIYRLAAWDVGRQMVGLGDVVVHPSGDTAAQPQRISLGSVAVFVRSVVPNDSSRRVPKPARGYLDLVRWHLPPWWWLAIPLAALVVLALLWRWWRRWRRARVVARAEPYAVAQREFLRVHQLDLLEAGEYGRYVALHVDIVRAYLAHLISGASTALTSDELCVLVESDARVPSDRLAALLAAGDAVKFAEAQVTIDRAREIAREAKRFVSDVHG